MKILLFLGSSHKEKKMNLLQALNIGAPLFVICSPFVAVPMMITLTQGYSESEKRRVGLLATCAVACILLGSSWLGTSLFTLLGIRLAALQIGGGIVVFLLGLSTLQSKFSSEKGGRGSESIAIVPLAIPLIAGPGAISQVIIASEQFPGLLNQVYMSLIVLVVACLLGLCLRFSVVLEKLLGGTGLNVANNLGGLLLIAIAVETMIKGFIAYFPALAL
ncbi:MAG: MarC family protein [Chlamydiota bacterium]